MKCIVYLALAIVVAITTSLPVTAASPEFLCIDVTEIPQIECEALVVLYNSTNGDGWTDSTNWLTTNTPSDWYGVALFNGHVREINLTSNQLNGRIPHELGNLTSLNNLDLRANRLTGNLPPELGKLTNLTTLSLYQNQLSGNIPHEIRNLTNLRQLLLDNNQLNGTIPPELGNLTYLVGLDLGFNHLSGIIPSELSNLGNLGSLNLTNNQLSGSIPHALGNLANLHYLYLNVNQLSGDIPHELGNLINLKKLYLSGNQLSGGIPGELANLTNLDELWLSGNPLGGSIPEWLGSLTNLTWLSMEGNQLTGNIPPVLGTLTSLRRLMLNSNELSGSIPDELGNLTKLDMLWLQDNLLEGDVPPTLINLVNLLDPGFYYDGLDLDYNLLNIPLGYPDPTDPFQVFLSQKEPDWQLSQIQLFVDCSTVTEIPQTECESLVSLYNSTNGPQWAIRTHWLETSTPGNWYGVMVSNGHVATVTLNSNLLMGSLPAELCNLSDVWQLHLSANQLSGMIPSCLGIISSLNYLDLANNQFTGNIPPELGNPPDMIHLYLNGNQLSGNIPSELGNLTKICVLQLQDNKLYGDVPATFINLVYLDNPSPTCFDGLNLGYNRLNVPAGYPDPADPLQVFLSHMDPDWQLYQGFEQVIGIAGGELTSLDGRTDFLIPAGALNGDTNFTFIPHPASHHGSTWLDSANTSFELTADDSAGNPVTEFNLPLTVTLTYTDTDTTGFPEASLGLYYWESTTSSWTDAVSSCPGGEYTRDLVGNLLALPFCHLTEFGVFGTPLRVFLTVIRN